MKDEVASLRLQMDGLMREKGIRTLPGFENLPFFTGYESGRLFGWDQYFEGLLQLYAGWDTRYLRNSLILFLRHIDRDGYIPRTLPDVWWGRFHAQPFLAQQALLLLRAGDPLEGFHPEYYFRLKAYLLHWLRAGDVRGEGLAVWDHSGHSGMDNQYERAGTFHDAYCEGVDLNAYLVRECEALSLVAARFGESMDAMAFATHARRLRDAVNRWCWNERDGFYYDYHARENEPIRVKSIAAAAALWAGIPSPAQAERLVREHLLNPNEFARPWPFPALALPETGYVEGFLDWEAKDCCSWRAHTWMPTNYYAFQGLRAYGFKAEAASLAAKSRELFVRNPFREYYATESGAPWGRDPFWGWSSLALFMEEEAARGFDPTTLRDEALRIM
jgi:putative isomerase